MWRKGTTGRILRKISLVRDIKHFRSPLESRRITVTLLPHDDRVGNSTNNKCGRDGEEGDFTRDTNE